MIFYNQRFLSLLSLESAQLGEPVGELLGHRLSVAEGEAGASVVLLDLARVIAGSVSAKLLCQLRDKQIIDITHTPLPTGGAVQIYEDATERLREEKRLRDLANLDPLTNLPNRSRFRDHLENAVAIPIAGHALLILDMNRFKEVNDTLGHQVGDRLLQGVVMRVRRCLRNSDLFARLGGDEFGIIAGDLSCESDALGLAERINTVMEHPFRLSGHLIYSSVSIGVIMLGTGTVPDEPANLLRCADIAMYRAKAAGGNTCRVFEERMGTEVRERAALERDLVEALGKNQFSLRYQPQVDLATRSLCGAEALLRWHHPDRGFVSPDVFIGVAEDLGLIVAVGEWVLRTACAQAAKWPGLDIAVNVSPTQLRHPGFAGLLDRVLAETGLPPQRLEIEVTEGVLLDNSDQIMATLRDVVSRGIKVALDDFGTGYSNFSYLRQFPWHKLKIDRSFLRNLEDQAEAAAILAAVLALGRGLGVRVIAEGVETKFQLDLLRRSACDEVQGFLVGMPMEAAQFDAYRASWRQNRDALFDKPIRRRLPARLVLQT